MKAISVMKKAWRAVRTHKTLWLFGLFAAAGSVSVNIGEEQSAILGAWLWLILAAAALLALVLGVVHVVSEAALIEGVHRAWARAQPLTVRDGIRTGLRQFWRVLAIKVLVVLAMGLAGGLVALPAGLAVASVIPVLVGVLLTVFVAVVAVPVMLTVHFAGKYALRCAVIEDEAIAGALRGGIDFVHGRIGDSLGLMAVEILGNLAAGMAGGVAAAIAAVIGLLVYLALGLVAGVIVGAVLVAPVAIAITGALGAYRSGVWTVGYLEGRREGASA